MFTRSRERFKKPASSPVEEMLQWTENSGFINDDYLWRIRNYLNYARDCGLESQAVVDSCIDLATTYTDVPEIIENRYSKQRAWDDARVTSLGVNRASRLITMNLDPIYFEAILRGEKTYEGRAYKPNSDKNYPDIRQNDLIQFSLSDRNEEFALDAMARNLHYGMKMVCRVKDVIFAPSVHGVYQIPHFNGLGFQPMINGPSEMLQLQRAAVYHTFPGYHELIEQHGFLGIELEDPQLLTAA